MKSISRKTAVIMGAIALAVALIVPGAALAAGWQPLESNPQTCPMAGEQDIACVGFVDADGNGMCDNRGSGAASNCGNFVDADGDGACDNWEGEACPNSENAVGQGKGCGNGGCGMGRGMCGMR